MSKVPMFFDAFPPTERPTATPPTFRRRDQALQGIQYNPMGASPGLVGRTFGGRLGAIPSDVGTDGVPAQANMGQLFDPDQEGMSNIVLEPGPDGNFVARYLDNGHYDRYDVFQNDDGSLTFGNMLDRQKRNSSWVDFRDSGLLQFATTAAAMATGAPMLANALGGAGSAGGSVLGFSPGSFAGATELGSLSAAKVGAGTAGAAVGGGTAAAQGGGILAGLSQVGGPIGNVAQIGQQVSNVFQSGGPMDWSKIVRPGFELAGTVANIIGNRAANSQLIDAANRAADGAQFRPFNYTNRLGGAQFGPGTVTNQNAPEVDQGITDAFTIGSNRLQMARQMSGQTPDEMGRAEFQRYLDSVQGRRNIDMDRAQGLAQAFGTVGINDGSPVGNGQAFNPIMQGVARGFADSDFTNYGLAIDRSMARLDSLLAQGYGGFGGAGQLQDLGESALNTGAALGGRQMQGGANAAASLLQAGQAARTGDLNTLNQLSGLGRQVMGSQTVQDIIRGIENRTRPQTGSVSVDSNGNFVLPTFN